MGLHTKLVQMWHAAVARCHQLSFSHAAELIPDLLDLSLKFQAQAQVSGGPPAWLTSYSPPGL